MIEICKLTKQEILDTATRVFGKEPRWFAFLAMPKAHKCLTYREHDMEFFGADYYATRKNYDLELRVFYREDMLPEDRDMERAFESAVRNAGSFTKDTGYNADEKMFYTLYTFNVEEEF